MFRFILWRMVWMLPFLLAISFISRSEDEAEMQKVQDRFAVQVPELPETIDTASYM